VLGYDRNTWASRGENAAERSSKPSVPEERYRDEIIERNLIIAGLYEERDRLQV
jgi:hypothetical protein